ncbi:MAG: cholesterol esterase [Catenulispora sp.]|nr:cholesterol esterase [Catenulispora sp.]
MATKPARGEGKVRFRRAAVPGLAAMAAAGTLVVLTAQGALGVQFAISGMPFDVTASSLHGEGFQQYGGLDQTAPGSPNLQDENGQQLVFVSVIRSATIHNMCQSVNLVGTNLLIKAGTGSKPVQASNLVLDSDSLAGQEADFKNIQIGQDASTMTEVPSLAGPLGVFGQQADTVDITNVRQHNWAATAATFQLPDLSMSFSDNGC